jgi:hypothetical protein
MSKLPLLLILAAALAFVPTGGASAAGIKRCPPPKGTRAPTKALHAGYKTSCSAARQVALTFDRRCEPYLGGCSFDTAGRRWSCSTFDTWLTHNAPPKTLSRVYAKCVGSGGTRQGRPSANFYQARAVHHCKRPAGTAAQIRFVTGYYRATCGVATPVAVEWDRACEPGANGSTCDFSARGQSWTCTQDGRDGIDAAFTYACTSPDVGNGRPEVVFQVRVRPLPAGVPDPG